MGTEIGASGSTKHSTKVLLLNVCMPRGGYASLNTRRTFACLVFQKSWAPSKTSVGAGLYLLPMQASIISTGYGPLLLLDPTIEVQILNSSFY